jgi:hypothetical protein
MMEVVWNISDFKNHGKLNVFLIYRNSTDIQPDLI